MTAPTATDHTTTETNRSDTMGYETALDEAFDLADGYVGGDLADHVGGGIWARDGRAIYSRIVGLPTGARLHASVRPDPAVGVVFTFRVVSSRGNREVMRVAGSMPVVIAASMIAGVFSADRDAESERIGGFGSPVLWG
jgi:hypothetical protein